MVRKNNNKTKAKNSDKSKITKFQKIKKYGNYIFSLLEKCILKLGDFAYLHPFGLNISAGIFLVIFTVYGIENGMFSTVPSITPALTKFLNICLGLGAFAFLIQSLGLLWLEYKIEVYKKTLKKVGFISFMEYEYKKNDNGIFSGLGYVLSLFISFIAIYSSFASMQLSLDIANSEEGNISMVGTEQMFNGSAGWLGALLFIFPLYFIFFKINQLTKRNYLERIYYGEYKK